MLGFEIKESEDTSNVYLVKDGTLFLLYGRKRFIIPIFRAMIGISSTRQICPIA